MAEELLRDFKSAEDIRKSNLLDIDNVDLSGTEIEFYETGSGGYHVSWKVEYAPMQLWLEVYSYFIGTGVSIILSIILFLMGNFGGYLVGTVFLGIAGFAAFKGYKLMNKEIEFDITSDRFDIVVRDMFEKKESVSYNELKGFDLLPTGTDENWGLVLAINLNLNKIILSGKPKSIKLLKGILEVILIRVQKMRKKQGKEDAVQVV